LFRKWGLPILAFLGLLLGLYMVHRGNEQPPIPPIPYKPATSPYATFIAASGIVEASSENVPIGVPVGQVVEEVYVQAGDFTQAGTALFKLNSSVLEAQKNQVQALIDIAKAELNKLIVSPRAEEVPPLEFAYQAQTAYWNKSLAHLKLFEGISDFDAVSKDEYQNALWDEKASFNSMQQAKANLDLKLVGSWIEDIQISSQNLAEKEKQKEVIQAQLDQNIIKAPFDGQVLQVKLYKGSYAQPYYDVPYSDAMLLYGKVDPLHIRINIDEEDAWRFIQNSKATAFVRGNSQIFTTLTFVRLEPYVIPKRSLTGDNTEQTDTRVLQVIYQFEKGDLPVYVGQVMDIFIEAPPYPL
jgi:hypothetical protein